MAEVINLFERSGAGENLIALRPLEFRRAETRAGFAAMCAKEESKRFEELRRDPRTSRNPRRDAFPANRVNLEGGYHFTVSGLFRFRDDEAVMRRVYRLAGLMECVTKASSPVLRTDLLRRFYKSITEEQEGLKVVWRGNVRSFLLPIHPGLYDQNLFQGRILRAESLKELYNAIEFETNAQFDILSAHYVFYLPDGFAH